MFSSIFFRRSKRAFSWILFGLVTFICLCFWNFNSIDIHSPYISVQRLRFFDGANKDILPTDFYKLPADDPSLVNIVRDKFIRPPSSMDYNLTQPRLTDFSRGQSPVIDQLLHAKEKGYFVECGAFDGEHQSVTLFFERKRNWRGLLVEADKKRYSQIIDKHRQAHTINACVRTDFENYERPSKSTERNAFFEGRPRDDKDVAPCFWLTTLLLATGQTTIDLISLDLNGKEMTLLKTFDFHQINVRTISLEIPISTQDPDIMDFVSSSKSHGYKAMHQFSDLVRNTKDLILMKNEG